MGTYGNKVKILNFLTFLPLENMDCFRTFTFENETNLAIKIFSILSMF